MNRTATENQRIEAFKALYGVTTQAEILALFKKDLIEFKKIRNDDDYKQSESCRIFSKYALAITFLYSLTSIKNNLKAYKKVITQMRIGDILQKKFYFEGLYSTVSNRTKAKIELKKEIDKEIPINVISEINRIKAILEKDSFRVRKNQTKEQVRSYYLAYILGLSTGRRFTEIFKTIKIHKKNNNFVFIGLLKKKDILKNQELKAHFLGLTALEARKYLNELRTYLNDKLKRDKNTILEKLTENQINTIFSKVYNNATARISSNKIKNFHELRHFYTITYQDIYLSQNPHLKNNSIQEIDVILKDVRYTILGHEIKEDTTSTYVTFK